MVVKIYLKNKTTASLLCRANVKNVIYFWSTNFPSVYFTMNPDSHLKLLPNLEAINYAFSYKIERNSKN